MFRANPQRGLFAGMAEQVQHLFDLCAVLHAEFKHRTCGTLLAQYLALNAAAPVGFLGKESYALVFRLQNHTAVIKVLTKTGHRISGGHVAARFCDPVTQDLIFTSCEKLKQSFLLGAYANDHSVRFASRCCMLGSYPSFWQNSPILRANVMERCLPPVQPTAIISWLLPSFT